MAYSRGVRLRVIKLRLFDGWNGDAVSYATGVSASCQHTILSRYRALGSTTT